MRYVQFVRCLRAQAVRLKVLALERHLFVWRNTIHQSRTLQKLARLLARFPGILFHTTEGDFL